MAENIAFLWTQEYSQALITVWGEADILRILEGKTKRNQLAYQKITEKLNNQYLLQCNKTQVISKIKYLKTQFTNGKKANRSGAGKDDILKVCPWWDELKPILDSGKLKVNLKLHQFKIVIISMHFN